MEVTLRYVCALVPYTDNNYTCLVWEVGTSVRRRLCRQGANVVLPSPTSRSPCLPCQLSNIAGTAEQRRCQRSNSRIGVRPNGRVLNEASYRLLDNWRFERKQVKVYGQFMQDISMMYQCMILPEALCLASRIKLTLSYQHALFWHLALRKSLPQSLETLLWLQRRPAAISK